MSAILLKIRVCTELPCPPMCTLIYTIMTCAALCLNILFWSYFFLNHTQKQQEISDAIYLLCCYSFPMIQEEA